MDEQLLACGIVGRIISGMVLMQLIESGVITKEHAVEVIDTALLVTEKYQSATPAHGRPMEQIVFYARQQLESLQTELRNFRPTARTTPDTPNEPSDG